MLTKTVRYTSGKNTTELTFTARFPTDPDETRTRSFALTIAGKEFGPRGRLITEWGGMAGLIETRKHAPEFLDVLALHLADVHGAPMHVEANAVYWTAGAVVGHMGEKHHGSNTTAEKRTPLECIEVLASHLRIDAKQALNLINHVDMVRRDNPVLYTLQTQVVKDFVQAQRTRWSREALMCLVNHKQGGDK